MKGLVVFFGVVELIGGMLNVWDMLEKFIDMSIIMIESSVFFMKNC